MAEKNDTRYRNWATVVYPESAPENWLDLLQGKYIPGFVSPLHDNDKNPTGEDKKAHYHVLFLFEGKKSKNQVQEIVDLINGVGLEHINSIRGYARYLCHLDNPEKAQYDINDTYEISNSEFISSFYSGTANIPKNIYVPEVSDKSQLFSLLPKSPDRHTLHSL